MFGEVVSAHSMPRTSEYATQQEGRRKQARIETEKEGVPHQDKEAASKENDSIAKRHPISLGASQRTPLRPVLMTNDDSSVEDVFCAPYRAALCERALLYEAWHRVRLWDERKHLAPIVVTTKRQSATRAERKVMRRRSTSAPSELGSRFLYLGHGRFGAVFHLEDGRALKVEQKRALNRLPWEALVLDLYWQRRVEEMTWTRLGAAVSPRLRAKPQAGELPLPSALYLWRDVHALAMPKYEASLADALRLARFKQPSALFFAFAALQAVGSLHKTHILHCDIKPDNFVLRFPRSDHHDEAHSQAAHRLAAEGFGLILVDLGRAVDLDAHHPHARFKSRKTHVDEFEWPPAKHANTSWRHEIDVYALGVVIFALACGRVPPTDPGARLACLPRGWNAEFWVPTFDALLSTDIKIPDQPPFSPSIPDLADAAALALDNVVAPNKLNSVRADLLQLRRHLGASSSASGHT